MNSSNNQWYALQVQSKMAKIASATLRGKGYEAFLPLYRACRRWSDRVKYVDSPLFPGYLFCRFDPHERLVPVLTTPGVMRIVSTGNQLIPVAEEEIEAVKSVLRSGLAVEPWPHLGVGSWVSIERGPLAGLEGAITEVNKIYRLVVSVTLLQRSVAVKVDRDWVRPISCEMAFAS